MIRGFYYSEQFNAGKHFAISVQDGRVGRWGNYEPANIGDTVILWGNNKIIIGTIIGDGKIDHGTWTNNYRFIAYPVEWTSATKRTSDVFPKDDRFATWKAIRDKQESSGRVQGTLQKVVDKFRTKQGTIDAYWSIK